MADEYEMISKKELDELRKKSSNPSQPAQSPFERQSESAKIIYLNNNVEKLNYSLNRLMLLFDQAQKEMISQGPDANLDSIQRVLSQNEKMSTGMLSMVNMIRDVQIQINQMSIIFKRLEERIEEMRLQRRPRPAPYKIPEVKSTPKDIPISKPSQSQQDTIEITTGPKHEAEIRQEEKKEDYAALDMMDDAPPPPPKDGFLKRFKK